MQKELKTKSEATLNDYFTKNLTNKMNTYFKNITTETKALYESTLNFYAGRKK